VGYLTSLSYRPPRHVTGIALFYSLRYCSAVACTADAHTMEGPHEGCSSFPVVLEIRAVQNAYRHCIDCRDSVLSNMMAGWVWGSQRDWSLIQAFRSRVTQSGWQASTSMLKLKTYSVKSVHKSRVQSVR
jgi:hypothetical protein